MITYADGTEARVGDRVDYDGEPAFVEAVIDSEAQQAHWGLGKPGLMFNSEKMGRVFEPANSITWDAILFLGRGDSAVV